MTDRRATCFPEHKTDESGHCLGGTHLGEWLGLPATGKHIEMRVMDFYRLENGVIQENWVPIDILWIFKQMGLDVLVYLSC